MNWTALGVALAVTGYCLLEMMLRCTPFWPTLDRKRKVGVLLLDGFLCLVNVAAVYYVMTLENRSSSIIKNDIFIMGFATMLVSILLMPERIREHLFVYGVTSICTYLLTPLATYFAREMVFMGFGDTYLMGSLSYTVLILLAYHPIRQLLKYTVEPFCPWMRASIGI